MKHGNPQQRATRALDRILNKPVQATVGWRKGSQVIVDVPGRPHYLYITFTGTQTHDYAINRAGVPASRFWPVLVALEGHTHVIVATDYSDPSAFANVPGSEWGGVKHPLNSHSDVTITDAADGEALVYDAVTGKWVNAPGGYSDEEAQDAVGGILNDSDTIDFTYTDATPSITAIVKDDSISNAKLSNMAQNTIKGRITASTGDPEDLTATQVRTLIDFHNQVRTSRLDQMAAPTASVGMNSQRITGLADPTAAQDAATKAYVDALAHGLDVKASVVVATTGNITLSGTQTIDGVAVSVGNRVLVKDQATASENGIYVVASGAWVRAEDANSNAEVTAGMFTFVARGVVNGDTGWVLTTNDPITLGTTGLFFDQFSGPTNVASAIAASTEVTPLNTSFQFGGVLSGVLGWMSWATITNALNSLFVRLTTDQTVNGIKRFVDNLTVGLDQAPATTLDVRGGGGKATTASVEYPAQVASTDSSNPLLVRLGIKRDATAANRYAVIDVDDGGTKRPLVIQATTGQVQIGGYDSVAAAGDAMFSMGGATPFLDGIRYQNNAAGPLFRLKKSRNGTVGSHTIVQNGDALGSYLWQGSDGTDWRTAAFIQVQVDGTPGASDMPGRIILATTPDGSATAVERARLDSDGNLGVGSTSPQARLHVNQATLGSEVLRLSSEATNDDPTEQFLHGRAATTNATTTTVVTIPITASNTYLIEARCVARRTGGTSGSADDGFAGHTMAAYHTVSGTLVTIGTFFNHSSGPAGWSFALGMSSNNVVARVTGATNNNITWHVFVVVRRVSS
jgi:hypothetical protein